MPLGRLPVSIGVYLLLLLPACGSDGTPEWPDTELSGSREREGERKETYTLIFRDAEGKEYTKQLSQAEWERYRPGEPVTLRVSVDGSVEIEVPETAETAAP